jgi:alpha-galactosidase
MKKILIVQSLLLLTGFWAKAQDFPMGPPPGEVMRMEQVKDILIPVRTSSTDLVFKVNGRDGRLYQVYLGAKLNNINDLEKERSQGHPAYATFGTDNLFEPAIRITNNDWNPSLELKYSDQQTEKIDDDVTLTKISLKDQVYPVEVTLCFKTFNDENVIEEWAEIIHHEQKPLTLFNYASSMLNFDAESYWLTQFHGDWAEEMRMQESALTSGIKIIDSKLGSRAHMYQTPSFMLSLNSKSSEDNGEVLAGTLAWSGNFRFTFEIDEKNSLRIISGINPFASEYTLQPGKPFITPAFIFTYSGEGKSLASRNLQRWALKYGILDGSSPRYTLLNNWEATGFDFNEKKLAALIDDTKKLGLDMFLLDDGWFANKYPRNNDRAGLGDWQENVAKLPDGIGFLTKEAKSKDVKFGIWIEPEMVNPKSELYEKRPDWILKLPNRPENYYRNQLVLDLANPKVQDFVYNIVDGLLTKYPDIAFFKWDCNRMMTNTYSPYLKDKQSHIYVEYVKGLYSVLDRVRQKYPHLPMMLCSGGGGRVDYGALKYFTEFWPSDNTDPVERVYIQWGYSYFFPSIAVCNHITSWGNESLKFRTDVAMMGKMGYDIQVEGFSDNDLKFSLDAIANYKRLEDLIWHGDQYRLISPYEENRAVLMYVSQDKAKALVFAYSLHPRFSETFNRVLLRGLDPSKTYKVREINSVADPRRPPREGERTYSGEYLMRVGLNIGSPTPLTSSVLEISKQD